MKSYTEEFKSAGISLIFYAVYGLLCWLLELAVPSGRCTPGLGVLLIFGLPIPSGFLFFRNLLKRVDHQHKTLFSTIIHGMVLLGYFLMISGIF